MQGGVKVSHAAGGHPGQLGFAAKVGQRQAEIGGRIRRVAGDFGGDAQGFGGEILGDVLASLSPFDQVMAGNAGQFGQQADVGLGAAPVGDPFGCDLQPWQGGKVADRQGHAAGDNLRARHQDGKVQVGGRRVGCGFRRRQGQMDRVAVGQQDGDGAVALGAELNLVEREQTFARVRLHRHGDAGDGQRVAIAAGAGGDRLALGLGRILPALPDLFGRHIGPDGLCRQDQGGGKVLGETWHRNPIRSN